VLSLALPACAREHTAAAPQIPAPQFVGARVPQSAIMYRLPVVGEWRVRRTHYGAKNDQAYALDLVIAGSQMNMRRGRFTNADFPSYGKPIVADAPGVVIIVVDGVPDNEPGIVNRYDMHGNYVVIDHENGEYSLMAHLIPGSITVGRGQRVNAGSQLGLCGNSGQSTMPHLHWQVMDNSNASVARGIPPRLIPYERNGATTVEIPQGGDMLVCPEDSR
jgi:murein DD-endopeptidase MepM/ murein hydrolase activator NlpD